MPKAKQFTLQCEQVITINNEPRFKIGNFLGHGGFGVTHEGFDLRHNRLGDKCSVKRFTHATLYMGVGLTRTMEIAKKSCELAHS